MKHVENPIILFQLCPNAKRRIEAFYEAVFASRAHCCRSIEQIIIRSSPESLSAWVSAILANRFNAGEAPHDQ